MQISVHEAKKADLYDVLENSTVRIENSRKVMDFCHNQSSMCWTGFVDDSPVCVWGLIPPSLLSDQAYLWLLTTPAVKDHRFIFVRHSQRWMQEMLKEYSIIVGHCQIGADESIRWLRWLGATFGEPQDNRLPFVIRAK
jgi:hypothetical protein